MDILVKYTSQNPTTPMVLKKSNRLIQQKIIGGMIDDDETDGFVDNKVLSDLHYQKEEAKMSSFDKTPIFAKEFYEDPYSDSLEELELELELEELEELEA